MYDGPEHPAFLHIGIYIYESFIVVISSEKRARCGGHVTMVTLGVKDGGCGVWAKKKPSKKQRAVFVFSVNVV